ncbi:hypothetical protein [Rickettsiales endosymbiont of Stachyamoeba lipophora]|uniref:hypothetical protein n=1 Tax=Rickettsiales endosymbiont of Stachyamoeba lipophora TaxID=2486578 RepID=UPI000F64C3F7|nr:hypothetical protein [Rickettsiales endosymbiont of Stachyamoeba lipophora]AZL15615.1 hypothetical protein EF513_03500 [Rickettsiales endosymbiont of Stachyamoeba lipophora]
MSYFDPNKIEIIIKAIKEADRGLFFIADYEKQAINVIKLLEKSGYRILPVQPTKDMIKIGVNTIKLGTNDPENLVKEIFSSMLKEVK